MNTQNQIISFMHEFLEPTLWSFKIEMSIFNHESAFKQLLEKKEQQTIQV